MDTSDVNLSNSTFEKDLLKYPDEVQAAINEIFPSDDPLDAPDFDPVDYINEMFPTEQSLVNLDDVLSDYKCKIHVIDEDMRRIVRGQTNVGEDAAASLEEAQVCNSQRSIRGENSLVSVTLFILVLSRMNPCFRLL